MSPELEQAVRERIELGHSKEQITNELRSAGYDEATVEHVYAATQSGAGAATAIPQAMAMLPSATDLFSASWSFMVKRFDLVLVFALPTLVMNLVGVGIELGWFSLEMGVLLGFGIGFLLLIIVQFVLQLALAHTALSAVRSAEMPFGSSWNWAIGNIWAWLWIATLVFCVVLGGSLLLLIPGLIASVYLMFVLYVYIDEGARGMQALHRSRELVYGNFWAVVGRFVVLLLIMFGIGLVFGLVFGVGAAVFSDVASPAFTLITGLFDGLLTGIASIIGVYFTAQLYDALRAQQAQSVPPTGAYTVFGWLGAVVFAGFAVLAAFGAGAAIEEYEKGTFDDINFDTAAIEAEMDSLDAEEQAEFDAFMAEFEAELGDGRAPASE